MTNIATQFKPGQSGNPGGRPKREWTWSGLLEQVGDETDKKTGKTYKELVAKRLWLDALKGNLGSQKEILNRMDGLPRQSTDITTGNMPLPVPIMNGLSIYTNKQDTNA